MERSAALLGLTKQQIVKAALATPQLFYQKPTTLNGNVEGSATLLGLTKAQFTVTASRHPSLFTRRPATLNSNAQRSAELLGVTKQQFIAAAMRAPALFGQRPDTVNGKKPYIMKIGEALGEVRDFASLLQKVPNSLCYSRTRLHARYVVAKLGLKRGAISDLVVLSAADASAMIVGHFTRQIERTGTGARALQVMHAEGLITTLPTGIMPIERPPRRPRGAADSGPLPPQ